MAKTVRFGCCILALLGLVLSGCARKEYIKFDMRYSYSLGLVQPEWPGDPLETLTPVQQEVYEQRGAPDFIRYFWRGNANFPTDVDPRYLEAEQIHQTRQSWIYIRQGDEVVFEGPHRHESVPISDKLALVIKHGDPESRQVIEDRETGTTEERWQYMSTGQEFRFHGDTLYDTRQFSDPMSGLLKR